MGGNCYSLRGLEGEKRVEMGVGEAKATVRPSYGRGEEEEPAEQVEVRCGG